MIKITGFLIILVFSSITGIIFAKQEKQRRNICLSLVEFFLYLSNEIPRHKPINQIICEFFPKKDEGLISAENREQLCEVLKEFAVNKKSKLIINRTIEFLENLGRSTNANTEAESCRIFYKELSGMYEEYAGESIRYSELSSKLGLMCGIAICILLM